MAKLYEVEIKNLQTFKGRHEEVLYKGDIYYKNKFLGKWSQDACGAICDIYNFNVSVLSEALEKFKKSNLCMNEEWASADMLLTILIELNEKEKQFKKFKKKGWAGMIVISNTYQFYFHPTSETEKECALKKASDLIKEVKKQCNNAILSLEFYSSLEDFDIK